MDTQNKQQGWLSSTKSFFSGVAKELGTLVTPIPDQSAQTSASNVSSPLGNSYATQQQQYGQESPPPQPLYGQPNANMGAFPTSHFPSGPPNPLAQMQPLNHPTYGHAHPANMPLQQQQPTQMQQMQPPQSYNGSTFNLGELQSVQAVSASPSPSPPPAIQQGAFPTYSQPLQPYNPLAPAMPGQQQPQQPLQQPLQQQAPLYGSGALPPSSYGSMPTPPPAARRVLDESSINPPLPVPFNGGYQPQSQPPSAPTQSIYGQSTLASPGRVLSPAFAGAQQQSQQQPQQSGQMMPSGNSFSRPPMPQPLQTQAQQPYPSQQSPQQTQSYQSQIQQQQYGGGGASGGGLLPPPPPVSNYWKQRAAVAPPVVDTDRVVGRVDYSDLDYKSMDFSYNNRYERPQEQQQQMQPHMQQQPQMQQMQQQQQQQPSPMNMPQYGGQRPSGYSN